MCYGETEALAGGLLATYWSIPLYSYSSTDPVIAVYPTLVRLLSPFNHWAVAVWQLFVYYNVSHIILQNISIVTSGRVARYRVFRHRHIYTRGLIQTQKTDLRINLRVIDAFYEENAQFAT